MVGNNQYCLVASRLRPNHVVGFNQTTQLPINAVNQYDSNQKVCKKMQHLLDKVRLRSLRKDRPLFQVDELS
jgi:hypothetical protein